MFDFFAWYFLITLAGWITFPVAFRLLPLLPDRGFALARALGLLLWGFGFWLLTSLGVLQNDSGGMLVGLAILVGLSVWSVRREGLTGILAWLKANKGLVITTEILFLAAFGFWAFIRAGDPNILGTEKPMEMAFINAILRSPGFPPNDPWLSGYSISYYYFGYVMVAMLARLSGVEPGVSFNLAISLWFALTAVSAYGVVYSLLSAYGAQMKSTGRSIRAQGWALLAPFFLLIVSNVQGFLEMLHARGVFWQQGADGVWYSAFWRWLNMPEVCNPPALPLSWIPERVGGIWWWRASRVIQDYDMSHVARMAQGEQCVMGIEVIDEFPFFSYYLADLHPHVLVMPFALLAVGLALHLFFRLRQQPLPGGSLLAQAWDWVSSKPVDWRSVGLLQWMRRVDFWLIAITAGGLAFLNTWDFPIYVVLFAAAFSLANYEREGWSTRRITEFIEVVAALGIIGVVLYLPFYTGFASQAGGVLPSLSFFTRGKNFWIMFAPLLAPILVWLIWEFRRHGNRTALRAGLAFSAALVGGLWLISYLYGGLLLGLAGLGTGQAFGGGLRDLGGFLMGLQYGNLAPMYADQTLAVIWNSLVRRFESPGTWLTLLALIAITWAGLAARRKDAHDEDKDSSLQAGRPVHAFVLLVVLSGAGLALAPEFVYLRDHFATRMNTIFKLYFQVWILWSLAAAYGTAVMWQRGFSGWKYLGRAVIGAVVIMGLAYPAFGLGMRISGMQPDQLTLDGTAHIERFNPDEMAAIRFLRAAPMGVVAEAVGGQYSAFARIATNTGLPNVLGWPGHQSQWRGGAREMGSREADIQMLYETPRWSDALVIIERYDIRYIYIGGLERGAYRVNETKFRNNLVPVFQQGTVVIYEVPERIVPASGVRR